MSASQLLVSLLGAEESDRLLRAIHAVLPPGAGRSIALTRPPEPRMGVAAVHLVGAEIAVVSAAGLTLVSGADSARERHFVWCRDDVEAASVPAEVGTAVVAETIDTLAWELVRRLTGDLSGREEPVGSVSSCAAGGSGEVGEASESEGPPAAPASPVRRGGRLPSAPAWAHQALPRGRAVTAADPLRRHPAGPAPRPPTSAQRRLATPAEVSMSPSPVTPLEALAAMERDEPEGELPGSTPSFGPIATADATGNAQAASGIGRLRGLISRTGLARPQRPTPDLSGLGQALLRAHSTVVTVGTPKGGPGKTTDAAAIGVLGARAVEPHGGSAVLVDANLNNPDSWRQLAVPSDALTVREVVEALNRGALVPNGEFARNERLRVLPERRSAGSAYSAAEIVRLVQHLRLRHTLIVVDLPNSLPSLSEGPKEALVAHWLQHADVVVLPIDLGEASFIAAGEILDAIDEMVAGSDGRMRVPGLVVPLLLPGDGRRALEIPAIAELLDHLRAAGAEVVEVPFTVDVQTASHRRSPIVGASPRTDSAFVGVLGAVVAARGRTAERMSRG